MFAHVLELYGPDKSGTDYGRFSTFFVTHDLLVTLGFTMTRPTQSAAYRSKHARVSQDEHRWMHFMRSGGCTLQQIASNVARSISTVKLHLQVGTTNRTKAVSVSKRVIARAKCVKRVAQATVSRCGKTRPASCGLAQIRLCLHRKHGYSVSRSTVFRDVKRMLGVSRVRPKVCSTHLEDYCRRKKFCAIHRLSSRSSARIDGSLIVFSDEKVFTTNDASGRSMFCFGSARPIPRENKRWCDRVLVWGAIGVGYRRLVLIPNDAENPNKLTSVNAAVYKKRVLQQFIADINSKRQSPWVFMQDGATAHTCSSSMKYLQNKQVTVLEGWPARSPDLNPIETLWAQMEKEVSRKFPQTSEELAKGVLEAFDEIPQSSIDKLVMSFNSRCEAVFKRDGGW